MQWRVGNVTITKVTELTSASIGRHILPDATAKSLREISWIGPFVDDEFRMVLSFHCFVVQTPDRILIVDTCIGNDKVRSYPKWNRMQSSFLADLQENGFSTDAIDTVLCTHMHVDHVGWNTYLDGERWLPTFKHARYLYARDEWQHWQNEDKDEFGPVIEDSVQPIFDLGLADLVDSTHQICDEVRLFPTPGHTPGHVSIKIESLGEVAVITGDIFHHPCQIVHPDWCATADDHQGTAMLTRQAFLSTFADKPVLCLGTHFAGPTAGQLVRDDSVYRLAY